MFKYKREGFSHIKVMSACGMVVIVILGILSLNLSFYDDPNVSVRGQRLSMAPRELAKFKSRPKFDSDKEYQTIGVELFTIENDSVLLKLGLQKNDIVKTFNGVTTSGLVELAGALYELQMNPGRYNEIKIEIIRDNKHLTVTYYVDN